MEAIDVEQTQTRRQASAIDPLGLALFYSPPGTLRLTVDDAYSYAVVKLYQAAPLSMPGRCIALQNAKGEEIAMVASLEAYSPESQAAAREEIQRRYLTSTVRSVNAVRTEFGVTYWTVLTDRGEREFVIQSLSDSCIYLSGSHILLIDVDGNRFDIPDRFGLDAASLERLNRVL